MTTRQELTDPFDVAVQEAMDELGEGEPNDTPAADPADGTESEVLEDQASEEESEQAESELEPPEEGASGDESTEEPKGDDEDELFADLEVPDVEEKEGDEPSATPDEQTFELPGIDEPVSLQELKDGYLRQADYTRKTQSLATERKDLEQADALWKALKERPHDVAKQLAQAAGLIEEGAEPVKAVDLPFRSEEDIQAEVDRKVAEALESHPDIQEAQKITAERWVESEFERIEKTHNVKLGPKSREIVLKEALAKNVDDLELVFQALRSRQEETARQRASLKQGAPAKPTGKATPQAVTEEPDSFDDAVAQAAAEIGIDL